MEKTMTRGARGLLHEPIPRAKVFPGPAVASPAYDCANAACPDRPDHEPVDGAGLRCFESEYPMRFPPIAGGGRAGRRGVEVIVDYPESTERAWALARSALALMEKQGVAPSPKNFAVWYLYFSGREPELVRSLDNLMDGARELTDEVNDEAYRRFVTSEGESAALEDAALRIRTELDKVVGVVASAGAGAAEYGDALNSASTALAGVDKPDQLSAIVANIVTATRLMEERNETLETRLGESAAEIEQLKVNLAVTRREAMTDALTGILNRSSFDAQLARAVQEAQKSRDHLSLLMVDIDDFKKFNDNFGHQVGDKVLALTAATLNECTKGQDIAARYGGEEFAVVLPRTDLRGAALVGDSVRQRISE